VTTTLRVGGVPEHFNLPWHLAIESGEAEGIGAAVDWRDYASGTGAMLADLAAARLDLAVVLTEGAAFGLARGLPIEAVSLYTASPLIWGVHVPPASDFVAIGDLGSARFAISRPGSGSHLMSLALAIEQGWPADGLVFEVVDDLPGAVEAFREGRADAFLWEHFTTGPQVEAGVFRRVGDFVPPWPAWVVCASLSCWQRDRDRIAPLLELVADGARRLLAAQDRAALIAGRYGLGEPAVEQWLATTEWVPRPTPPADAIAKARFMLETAGAI